MSVATASRWGVLPGHGRCLLCPWTASGENASDATQAHTVETSHPSIYLPVQGANGTKKVEPDTERPVDEPERTGHDPAVPPIGPERP